MSQRGDLKKLISRAERQGFRHVVLSNNHHRFYAPDKKTIIQRSSSTRDGGWFHKFLREMAVAGYRHHEGDNDMMNGATTNLGEVLKEAISSVPPAPQPRRGDISGTATDYMRQHSDRAVSGAELLSVCEARLQRKMSENSIWSWFNRMAAKGVVVRRDAGTYQWVSARTASIMPTAKPTPPAVTAQDSDVVADGYVDPDERELDEALAALGRIEAVVRKYKTKIRRFKELQRLISGEDL